MRRNCGLYLLIFIIILGACRASPRLDLESDQSYTESVAEIRSTLESEEQRELLTHMLASVRGWRTEQHEELMETPALTPAQQTKLDEMELEHQVRVYELLHDQDIDGIAKAYHKYSIASAEKFLEDSRRSVEEVQALLAIETKLIKFPEFEHLIGDHYTREIEAQITNNSNQHLTGLVGLECRLTSVACNGSDPEKLCSEQFLNDFGGKKISPKETVSFRDFQSSPKDHIVDAAPSDFRCWVRSASLLESAIQPVDEVRYVYLSSEPEQALKREQESVEIWRKHLEEAREADVSFELFFEEWLEANEEQPPS